MKPENYLQSKEKNFGDKRIPILLITKEEKNILDSEGFDSINLAPSSGVTACGVANAPLKQEPVRRISL